jgi:glucosamine-6-phosphate deaminase
MEIVISESREELAKKAAKKGAELIRAAIKARGEANIIVPAGASQFEMIAALVKEDLNWSVVTAFHLDEYIGLPVTHPASFRKYLKERFADKVMPRVFNYVNGEIDPEGECKRLGKLISKYSIDVAFVGIGENAHLAFNDPPADFDTDEAYIVVNLDEACRKQQLGEGWFPTFDDVPKQAISMSIKQIMKTKSIICTVPDLRKADAVKKAVKGPVTNMAPSSIMQKHAATWLYLDKESASLL